MQENSGKRQAKYDAVSFSPNAKVPVADKWCLGFTAFATTVPWVLFGYFLTYFYTDVIGMSGVLAGSLMMFARVFDAFTDLMIGWCITSTSGGGNTAPGCCFPSRSRSFCSSWCGRRFRTRRLFFRWWSPALDTAVTGQSAPRFASFR